ncbi:MAG: crossover junction endodeoxyribonuclease RuvC [Deltaproteobacteria bacterium]|nr:crossover junction endodeoxyribonuclease RuvC [Deltaproteobacteria bacterium]
MSSVILGIDPGSRHTGFGVFQGEGNRLEYLAAGSINPGSKNPLADRLRHIFDSLTVLVHRHRPQALALEEVFLAANVKSAFTLGQVRGIVLLLAAQSSLPVFHYPPLAVKKAVVGYGQATKAQVQLMVEQLLGQKVTDEHAADALAVGLCHYFHQRWLDVSS